ncbi:cytochrome P450 26B1-like [Patella vulgata]|uniref:cytochrome P450 26B1-like n=1 Tax=Patella vulgata TaxID=6465 RepID=UPI0021800F64|nr:cytochrome P450 26B1-like [Patella vulgata]
MELLILEEVTTTGCLFSVIIPSICPLILLLLSWKLWYVYYNVSKDPQLSLPLPPGSLGFPLVGETLSFIMSGAQFFKNRKKFYGNVFKTHLLGNPTIRVSGAKNVRKILLGENSLVTTYWPTSVRMLMGDGAISHAIGATHRMRRKALLKAFSHDALTSYVPIIQEVVQQFIQKWCREGYVFGYPECKRMAFKVACRVLVGFNMPAPEHQKLLTVFHVFLDNLFSLPFNLPGSGLSKGMKARKILLERIEECIQQKQTQENDSGFNDAMKLMMDMEGDEKLNLEELKDVGLELLFAGHATCASAAASLLSQLAKKRAVVDRIADELKQHGLEDDRSKLSYDVINKLSFVSNVVKETLRISPPVGAGFRKVIKSFELDGYQVPRGWTLAYSIRETQEAAEMFSDGEKFDPDRWNQIKDEKFHYLPFGAGSRACPGKELAKLILKIFAIELSRSCTWKLLNESAQINYLPVPHAADGLPVEFSQIITNRPRAFTI